MHRGSWLLLLWLPPIAALTAFTTWHASDPHLSRSEDHRRAQLMVWLAAIALLLVGTWRTIDYKRALKWWLALGLLVYSVALTLLVPIIVNLILEGQIHRNYRACVMLLLVPLIWVGVTAPTRGEWERAAGGWLLLFSHFFAVIYQFTHGVMWSCPWFYFYYLD